MRSRFSVLSAKQLALTVIFASFYTVFFSWPLFPLVGGQGRFIQAGNVIAPLIGIILGPYIGVFAIAIGGVIGAFVWQSGPFGPLSFLPHMAVALCTGLLYNGKKLACGLLYLFLLLVLAFYPVVGPAWLWPPFLWLHVAGLAFLVSPVQLKVDEFLHDDKNLSTFALAVGGVSFTATLFGHIVGSLMFEVIYWPSFISEVAVWKADWQLLMWLYPVERLLITIAATAIGVGLLKALRIYGFEIGG